MDPTPFKRLKTPRFVNRLDLPEDLQTFYTAHEGVGLESTAERIIRLCRLSEVQRIGWEDVHIFGEDPCPGWEDFEGLRIGVSSFFDEIVLVEDCPTCPAGSILTIGVDVAGPGGDGPHTLDFSLVLSPGFSEWLANMERADWTEYGLLPGCLADLPEAEERQWRRYFKRLNPHISWGGT